MGVCLDLICAGQSLEPGEGNGVLINADRQGVDAKGLFDEGAFDLQEPSEVADRHLFQRDSHRKPHVCPLFDDAVLGGIRGGVGAFLGGVVPQRGVFGGFALEASIGQSVQHLLDLLAIGAVVEYQGAVLGNREVIDLVAAGGHELVFSLGSRGVRDDLDQFLTACACYIVLDFHCGYLLCFGSHIFALHARNSKLFLRQRMQNNINNYCV